MIVVFLLTFGFNFFTTFFQVFLIDKFEFTSRNIGFMFAYIGVWIAFTQGVINRKIAQRFRPQEIIRISIFMLAAGLYLVLTPPTWYLLLLIQPIVAISQGLTQPNITAIVSGLASEDSQGEIMGINQALQSIGMAVPPIIGGLIVSINRTLPIAIAGSFIFVAWLVFLISFKSAKEKFHQVP